MKSIAFGLLLLVAAAAARAAGEGEDWPCFLGPRQDGSSTETGLAYDWPEKGPPEVWRRRVGNAYSAPVVAKGKLVLFHRVKDEAVVEAVEPATGAPIWKFAYPTHYEDRYGYNNGPRSSPTIDGDRVYTYGAEGVVTCVDFESGKMVWQRPVNAEYHIPQGFFGAGVAPVIEGNLILLNIGATDGASVVALDKGDGKTVWQKGTDEASYSTPLVRTIRGERMGIFFTREGLRVHSVKDGTERYSFPFRSRTNESVNAATPVVKDDLVFLSATYNTGAVLLRLAEGGLQTVWQDRTAMQNHWATSYLDKDGHLYGMDGRHEAGSNFRCIEFMTGKVNWTADQGLGRASFVAVERRLVAIGERGDLAQVELNPERYVEKGRARVLRYPCWTPPVLSHGLLYLRDEDTMLCLDLRPKP